MASNIAEGSEHGSDREFMRFLIMANASNAEVEAQMTIAQDIDLVGGDVQFGSSRNAKSLGGC